MSDISTTLYWSMPTPKAFLQRVSDAARAARALILNFPHDMPSDPIRSHMLDVALRDANILSPLTLTISDGMNIASEVGSHFDATVMPAQSLAHHVHGAPHAIVLQANGRRAQQSCEQYAQEFMSAITDSVGDIRLILAIYSNDHVSDASIGGIRVIVFDGGLRLSEMSAYVAMRMVSYQGPGSTDLLKHLVVEYSSFDPRLAERLSNMDQSSLLNLPYSLSDLMNEDALRWARDTWVDGVRSLGSNDLHPLREWYLATHMSPSKEAMTAAAQQRYWRACLKALVPWLEERRFKILELLDRQLTRLEKDSGGPGRIVKKAGGKDILVGRSELEYGDLVYQSFGNSFRAIQASPEESAAISICKTAKGVRDDIAHFRAPNTESVMTLISSMDSLLPSIQLLR